MSRRNAVCPKCGKKGRADTFGGGPPCFGVWRTPTCTCGTPMKLDDTPPKNRKPAVAPDGHKRRV